MYYRKALELQAFLDMAKDDGIFNSSAYYVVLNMAPGNCIDFSLLSAFIRSYERLQSNRTHVWGLSTNDTMQSDSWHEVHLCCLMPAVWNPETFWWSLCTWYFKTNDNVSFSLRLESSRSIIHVTLNGMWLSLQLGSFLCQPNAIQTCVHSLAVSLLCPCVSNANWAGRMAIHWITSNSKNRKFGLFTALISILFGN